MRRRSIERAVHRMRRPGDDELVERTIPRAMPSAPPDEEAGPLPPAIDRLLWRAHVCFSRERDPELCRLLVDEYQGLALSLARRMHRDGEPLDDLTQVALEALLLALDRFDPEHSVPFVGFALPTIVGSLKRHYRDVGWLVRVPRRVHELAAPARRAADQLTAELGRSPSLNEVADRLGVDVEDLLVAQEAASARSTSSLDATLDGGVSPHSLLGGPDRLLERADDHIALERALGELQDRERLVLRLYFEEERSQSEIAERFGVSQMQVSRWLSLTVRRLRSHMCPVA